MQKRLHHADGFSARGWGYEDGNVGGGGELLRSSIENVDKDSHSQRSLPPQRLALGPLVSLKQPHAEALNVEGVGWLEGVLNEEGGVTFSIVSLR